MKPLFWIKALIEHGKEKQRLQKEINEVGIIEHCRLQKIRDSEKVTRQNFSYQVSFNCPVCEKEHLLDALTQRTMATYRDAFGSIANIIMQCPTDTNLVIMMNYNPDKTLHISPPFFLSKPLNIDTIEPKNDTLINK